MLYYTSLETPFGTGPLPGQPLPTIHFKKLLCVPGLQQENVPEHVNDPPPNMVSSKSGLTFPVESTGPGDHGLDGGSEGSGRVGHQQYRCRSTDLIRIFNSNR